MLLKERLLIESQDNLGIPVNFQWEDFKSLCERPSSLDLKISVWNN